MPGHRGKQSQVLDSIQRYELGVAVFLPFNGVSSGGSQRLEDQLDDPMARRWGAYLEDEKAALHDDVQACLLSGLSSSAGDHPLPWP